MPPGTAVRADPDRIEQAVANLIDNTLRYGAGPTTLGARVDGGSVEIHVTDGGPGFGEQFLPHAFDRFSRGDPARRRGGVGLGLAIVRTIAQAHGGDAGARRSARRRRRRVGQPAREPVPQPRPGARRLSAFRSHPGLTSIAHLLHAMRRARPSPTGGGTAGNERLTGMTGALLVVVLAAVGVTIVWIGQLLWLHLFLGLLVIGPVALKLLSTGYRFARYYTHSVPYRRRGPPHPLLRVLAALVVLSTLAVFATGVALLLLGPELRAPVGAAAQSRASSPGR